MINEFKNVILKLKEKQKSEKFNCGFDELNEYLQNIEAGSIITVAGRPAMGKTSLIMSFINNLLEQNKKNCLFSLDNNKEKIIQKLISIKTRIDFNDNSNLNESTLSEILNKEDFHIYNNLCINDKVDLTIEELEKEVEKNNPEIVFIDYIQLLKTEKELYGACTTDYALKELKRIATDNKIIIFLTSQVSRNVEKRDCKYPTLFDLKNTSFLEDISDVVMMIYREKYYDYTCESDTAEILIVKNKSGAEGVASLEFKNGIFSNYQSKNYIKIEQTKADIFYAGEHLYRIIKYGKYGFVSDCNGIIIEPKYDDTSKFLDGFCAVKLDEKWAFIDKNGKEVTDFIYNKDEALSGVVNLELNRKGEKNETRID